MFGDSNPLTHSIAQLLMRCDGGLKEYDIIAQLQPQLDSISALSSSKSLALFQTHFLVMNALYQLQRQLADDGLYLAISPLNISLLAMADADEKMIAESTSEQSLREYYLDWSNLEGTSEEDVESLLKGFWEKYHTTDKQLSAYQTLNLEPDANWQVVQRQYRRLVAENHPDRGGDAVVFMAVREAYELLLSRRE